LSAYRTVALLTGPFNSLEKLISCPPLVKAMLILGVSHPGGGLCGHLGNSKLKPIKLL